MSVRVEAIYSDPTHSKLGGVRALQKAGLQVPAECEVSDRVTQHTARLHHEVLRALGHTTPSPSRGFGV